MKLKRFEQFSQETPDIIDFPVKKLMYVIRKKVEGNLVEGKNIFNFDFKEKDFNIKLTLKINYLPENKEETPNAYYNKINNTPTITVNFNGTIDYNELFSIIGHELKHAYDFQGKSDERIPILSRFIKYKDKGYAWFLIQLCYIATKEELDARYSMIYDLLRGIKTYDKHQLEKIMVDSEPYKQLKLLGNVNFDKIIANTTAEDLKDIIMQLWFYYGDYVDYDFDRTIDTDIFIKQLGDYFKEASDEYIKKCHQVLDELIRDKKPYMEKKSF